MYSQLFMKLKKIEIFRNGRDKNIYDIWYLKNQKRFPIKAIVF